MSSLEDPVVWTHPAGLREEELWISSLKEDHAFFLKAFNKALVDLMQPLYLSSVEDQSDPFYFLGLQLKSFLEEGCEGQDERFLYLKSLIEEMRKIEQNLAQYGESVDSLEPIEIFHLLIQKYFPRYQHHTSNFRPRIREGEIHPELDCQLNLLEWNAAGYEEGQKRELRNLRRRYRRLPLRLLRLDEAHHLSVQERGRREKDLLSQREKVKQRIAILERALGLVPKQTAGELLIFTGANQGRTSLAA